MSYYASWTLDPGHVFRVGLYAVTVVDVETNEALTFAAGTLMLTLGVGAFLCMNTGQVFHVDELDACILEYDAEELAST